MFYQLPNICFLVKQKYKLNEQYGGNTNENKDEKKKIKKKTNLKVKLVSNNTNNTDKCNIKSKKSQILLKNDVKNNIDSNIFTQMYKIIDFNIIYSQFVFLG